MTGAVSKVYSQALFELAAEEKCADTVYEELCSLKKVWEDNPGYAKLLGSPAVGIGEKLGMVEKAFKGRISEITYNMLCVLVEKNRAAYLPSVAEGYKEKWYELKNIVEVRVTTSTPLSDVLRSKLQRKLESVYKKTVYMRESVDPKLIGGIVISYGNTMLDGSVRSKLEAMQKQIKGIIA